MLALSDLQMTYIQGCYKYQKYNECTEHCNKLEHFVEARIYKAKALYNVYTQEYILLSAEQDKLLPHTFRQKHESCFAKAKVVVGLLGRVLDESRGKEPFDRECSRILDLAMMDCIFETNKLRDTQRCFLCRIVDQMDDKVMNKETSNSKTEITNTLLISAQKLTLSSEHAPQHEMIKESECEPSIVQVKDMDMDNVEVKTKLQSKRSKKTSQRHSLQASHLFPESIIKRFVSAVPLAKGKKVITIKGFRPTFDPTKGSLHSHGEATLYMLCHECEQLLSVSESWFLRNFFSKVYDTSDPSKPREEQSIPYSDQLYKFCVGLIFRLLNHDTRAILNPQEIHHLLEKCRAVLRPESVHWSVDKPDIYLLVTPVDESGDEYGLINQFLTGTMSRLFGMHHLNTEIQSLHMNTTPFAHFIVIHMGVINILVKFQPSADYEIDQRFRILPDGGVYTVPQNDHRKRFIPPGVYTLFQVHAMKMEKEWLEGPSLTYEPLEDPDKNLSEMFGILKAEALDESRITSEKRLTHVSTDHVRILCFLPPGFDVSPLISVPRDHTILLHHTHGDQERGVVLFLGVGYNTSEGYGIEKPYVITYCYQPGYIFASCCFISLDKMQPVGFLPKTRGTSTVKNQDELLRDDQLKDYASIIQCTLKEKGFHSLRSLIYRLTAIGYEIFSVQSYTSVYVCVFIQWFPLPIPPLYMLISFSMQLYTCR